MVESKGWKWEKANWSPWLKPTDDVYYLANIWSELGFKKVLDLGAGLGRHSIFFAQQGFNVSAIDISDYGVNHLKEWAKKEDLDIDAKIGDMVSLPYEDKLRKTFKEYYKAFRTGCINLSNEINDITIKSKAKAIIENIEKT